MAFFHECIAYIVSKPKNQGDNRIKPASVWRWQSLVAVHTPPTPHRFDAIYLKWHAPLLSVLAPERIASQAFTDAPAALTPSAGRRFW